MYLWSSLNYHAILLTFYELRDCHKKTKTEKKNNVHKPQQLRNDEIKAQPVKFSTDNNTDIFLLHAIKLFWKGHSIVQTLDAPFVRDEKEKVCFTLKSFVVCMK